MDHPKKEGDEHREGEMRNSLVLGRWTALSSAWFCMGSNLFWGSHVFYSHGVHEVHLDPSDKFFSFWLQFSFSSVAHSCPTLWDPMNCSTPGLPIHHQLPEPTQTHAHWVSDAIQPSHPLSSPSPPALNLSQHQGLFKWVSSLHQVAKVLELHLQHQSFQWIFRTDFL